MQNSLILYMQFKAWLIVVNYVMSEINLDYKNVSFHSLKKQPAIHPHMVHLAESIQHSSPCQVQKVEWKISAFVQ